MEYYTLSKETSCAFVEQKSKFISYAKPIYDEYDAQNFIQKIQKKHFDAKHNVYAYTIKLGDIHRYSDDGEPSGTAGMPILEILSKNNILNSIIIVTRYFGGILLGTGGLARAYSKAAKDVLQISQLVKICLCIKAEIICTYKDFNSIENLLAKINAKIIDKVFDKNIKLYILVANEEFLQMQTLVKNISSGSAKVKKLEQLYTSLN